MGAGVVGIIECNYLTPTHNKQDFDNNKHYRSTMFALGQKLNDYWLENLPSVVQYNSFTELWFTVHAD